ncbi:MAG: hypothetical protein IT198_14170 [Acidimicrobiia bacterium]|nr:hypothetical protein [Acidimicrobiia bacterium]
MDTRALVRVYRYVTGMTVAYWEAHLDGRLSRFVAPPAEVEDTMICMTEDIWRSVGDAIRTGKQTAVVRTSLDPNRLIVGLDSASRMLAFLPYAREAGVEVPDDSEAHMLLVYMIEEFVARAKERLNSPRTDLGASNHNQRG